MPKKYKILSDWELARYEIIASTLTTAMAGVNAAFAWDLLSTAKNSVGIVSAAAAVYCLYNGIKLTISSKRSRLIHNYIL